jgi:TPP-dependent pyruvate/acetoin dehydrogenase alpha subunit
MNGERRLELLRQMLLVRRFEDAWGEAYRAEEIEGIPPALSTGQEAVSVGACAALESGDYVFTTHRGQAPQIAMGLDPKRIMAELYCRRDGYNKGKSYHVTDVARGVIGMGGVIGAQVPVAAGTALAQKMRGARGVSLAFFGDGTANEGVVHETMNLATIWDLPLILVCENNGFCISMPVSASVKTPSIAERAAAYGMPGVRVDGNDPEAVYEAVHAAAERARAGRGASFVEARTVRLGGHLAHDPQRYRDAKELAAGFEKCPIRRYRERLESEGLLSAGAYEEMVREIEVEVNVAREFARQSPSPAPDEAFDDLWA